MLFSRSRPNPEKVAAMLRAAEVASAVTAAQQQSGRAVPRTNVVEIKKPAIAQMPLIRDIKDVPEGRYVPLPEVDIPERFREVFAFLSNGHESGILLTAVDVLGTHPQFEVERRLKDYGISKIDVKQATREIIKSIHERHQGTEVEKATKVEEIAWQITDDAVQKGASDIHIECLDSYARVWYRIFGERIEQPGLASQTASEVCRVLYGVHGDEDSKGIAWNQKIVQNTVINRRTVYGKECQLRFSSSPRHPSGNFHAVMRALVMDEKSIRPLEQVGYTDAQVAVIEEMLMGGRGMVVLVGPTNSGKSSALQSAIERIYDMRGRSIKVLTAEDPVEYIIPDAVQMSAQEGKEGADFEALVGGMLRQDPDVVMVGEIRDGKSAEHVKHLVLAGRKLLTTLHVYEVLAVYARLREMGVPDSVLYMENFISGVICQRLVPHICPNCSVPIDEAFDKGDVRHDTYERVRRVTTAMDDVCVRGHGCKECNHVGLIGRTPCAELLVPDTAFLAYMARGDLAGARQYWTSHAKHLNIDGMGVTMIAHAIHKIKKGMVDPRDVEALIGRIAVDTVSVPTGGGSRVAPLIAQDFTVVSA
jgi:type II secretory ATPase GspE/PulE/Tfp pilus assembly ATPase PilB-like protein